MKSKDGQVLQTSPLNCKNGQNFTKDHVQRASGLVHADGGIEGDGGERSKFVIQNSQFEKTPT